MKIHISTVTYKALHKAGQYILEFRGEVELKVSFLDLNVVIW